MSMQVDEARHDHFAADIYHPLRFTRVDVRCNLGDLPLRHRGIKPASQALTWIEYLSTLDEYVCHDTLFFPPPTPPFPVEREGVRHLVPCSPL
jgi:hypothetical protein